MEEMAISKSKATCLSVMERVRKTKKPVRVTRFGEPVCRDRSSHAASASKKLAGRDGRLGQNCGRHRVPRQRRAGLGCPAPMRLLLGTHTWL